MALGRYGPKCLAPRFPSGQASVESRRIGTARPHPAGLFTIPALIGIAAIGWLLAPWLGSQPSWAIMAALVIAATAGVMVARYLATRNVLDPLILFSGAIMWYFGIHTFWLDSHPQASIAAEFTSGLAPSLALLLCAFALLVVVYQAANPRFRGMRLGHATPAALIIVFAIGMAANVWGDHIGAFQKVGEAGSSDNIRIARTLGLIVIVCFATATVQAFRGNTSRWLAIAFGITIIGFGLAVNNKTIIVQVLLPLLVAATYGRKPVPVKWALAAVVVFMFVFTPIIQSGRESLAATGQTTSLRDRVTDFATKPKQLLDGFKIVNVRTQGSESFALSYLQTPSQNPYQYGKALQDIPLSLVPHQLWPGKPAAHTTTRDFSVNYARQPENGFSGLTISPTVPGDLYVNFGILGLLAGFALLGYLLKLIANVARHGAAVFAVPFFTVMMLSLILVESPIDQLGSTLLINLIAVTASIKTLDLLSRA